MEIQVGRKGSVGCLTLTSILTLQHSQQIHTDIQTQTHPSQDMGTDSLHPAQGLEDTVLLKDAAETPWHVVSCYGCGCKGCVNLTQETQAVT